MGPREFLTSKRHAATAGEEGLMYNQVNMKSDDEQRLYERDRREKKKKAKEEWGAQLGAADEGG